MEEIVGFQMRRDFEESIAGSPVKFAKYISCTRNGQKCNSAQLGVGSLLIFPFLFSDDCKVGKVAGKHPNEIADQVKTRLAVV